MPNRTTDRWLIPLALLGGILAVSTSSVLIRFAQADAPSLAIAAGRLAIATLVVAPFALLRHGAALRSIRGRDLARALAAGVFLAIHFGTWIASLERTSVVSSVVLVTTTPLWVALLAPFVLGERPTRVQSLGILVALAGGITVGLGDARAAAGGARHALGGDLLALAGAWGMAGYLIVGRDLRARLPLVPYIFVVNGAGALVLGAATLVAGQHPLAIPLPAWGWIALLALVPQLLGHGTFNWALRHLAATRVSIALIGEPVAAAALAWTILGETPSALTLSGAVVILGGIALASRAAAPAPLEPAG